MAVVRIRAEHLKVGDILAGLDGRRSVVREVTTDGMIVTLRRELEDREEHMFTETEVAVERDEEEVEV